MRYLVTGAQGFTGRFVCAEILRGDPEATVVGTGRSPAQTSTFTHTISWAGNKLPAPLPSQLDTLNSDRYRYVPSDLTDVCALATLVQVARPDRVIHLAAALRDDPADVLIKSNVSGTASLLQALTATGKRPRIVVGSSGSVYGVPQRLPLSEDQRCAPYEPYALSKLAAEFVARIAAEAAGIPLVVARIFNIAGPGQEERHVCGRFAAQCAAIAVGTTPLRLEIGDLRPTRDFIDVRDVARALVVLAAAGAPGEIYNVASGREVAIRDVLEKMLRTAELHDVNLLERYTRPADVMRAYAAIGKLACSGFRATISLDTTIRDLLDYYRVDVAASAATSAAKSSQAAIPSSQK